MIQSWVPLSESMNTAAVQTPLNPPGSSLLTLYTLGMLVELMTVWTSKSWTPFRRCAVFFSRNPALNSWTFLVMLEAAPPNVELTFSFKSKHLNPPKDAPCNASTHFRPYQGTQKELVQHIFKTLKHHDFQLIPALLYDVISSTSRIERESPTKLARWVSPLHRVPLLISSY
jgi:hypothetical protein